MTLILAFESSCDETAVALVGADKVIHAQSILSQMDDHSPYGGVVPEIAARQHIVHIEPLTDAVLREAGRTLHDIDAIAVTAGPGLIGGVIVGVMTAKSIASVTRKPCYAINHLEGHALSVRLNESVPFPYLLFLMSGGHCQILIVHGVGHYEMLGQTLDDAIGEAFDKTAKMMGLGFPGGVHVEAAARTGNPSRFPLPRPYLDRAGCDMSFSGLKTAVRTTLLELQATQGNVSAQDKADVSASLQAAIADIVEHRLRRAIAVCTARSISLSAMVIAGGVAANSAIRERLLAISDDTGLRFCAPPPALCTDNAAMIAWAAHERVAAGFPADALTFEPRARWPLAELTLHKIA
jgi:N6-L-threonylcarbamoyladenine synthase